MSKWFIRARQKYIKLQLDETGRLNRNDISSVFDISTPQASTDIKLFMQDNPGYMRYCPSSKAYVKTGQDDA